MIEIVEVIRGVIHKLVAAVHVSPRSGYKENRKNAGRPNKIKIFHY